MRSTLLSVSALVTGISSAAPISKSNATGDSFEFPLANGFPNPSPEQILEIQVQAGGTLPNGPPPPTLSRQGVTNLELIAFNELFEVSFFTELIFNVTHKVPGYEVHGNRDFILDALNAIVAQEELHLLNANGALVHFNHAAIEPCKYDFPVSDFPSAIALAATFTDVVLGTLQDVNQIFAQNGDDGLVRAVSSVIGNEGEQEGFYRVLQTQRPSSQPFLTTSVRDFAFTAIQSFTVPGSCPNINIIPLKTFKPLTVITGDIKPATQTLEFAFKKVHADVMTKDFSRLSLVYINQQNVPIVEQLKRVHVKGENVVFEAEFPYEEFLLNGLTIAAVTKGSGPFASADDVAEATIFGPGLIEVN